MIVDCFARRIMAPFQGVLQVTRVGYGAAESTDGRQLVPYAAHPDILAHSGLSDVRFGTWSAAGGRRRAMMRETAAGDRVERIGALEAFATQSPFPLQDSREFWLLDARTAEPVVLIDSRLADEAVPPAWYPRWLPGEAARDELARLDELERAIDQRAGRRPLATWVERDARGDATEPDGTRYPSEFFPRFMLTKRWPGRNERQLARAVIDGWVPVLLPLHHLSDPERARMERVAARRATALERLHRLYPKTIDTELIRVARVQARMQAWCETGAGYEEPCLWSA